MTKTQIESYRQRLLDMGKRLNGAVAELQRETMQPDGGDAAGNLSKVPVHPADLSSETYQEEVNLGVLENEAQLQQDIEQALRRIDAGSFGRCESCAQEIPRERLEVVPYARHCVECARSLSPRAP